MADEFPPEIEAQRRSFFAHLGAAFLGVAAFVAPLGAGLAVLADPVLRKPRRKEGNWIRVAALEQIPADGRPYPFAVIDPEPWDKWNRYDPQPVGSVYLVRPAESGELIALSGICPHMGCTVDFRPASNDFRCPCHNAMFTADGKQLPVENVLVSPRDLDPLEVRVDQETGEVAVNYKRFKQGISDRVENL